MSAQTPVCQLLERQEADYRDWWWVGPPQDAWLEATKATAISADAALLARWQSRGLSARSPFAEAAFAEAAFAEPLAAGAPAGAVLFWPKSHALGEWWLLWLCATLPPGTPLQLVGENQGGIKRVLKVLAALGLGCRKLDSARRCALYASRTARVGLAPEAVWTRFEAADLTLASHPGLFGHGKFDDGTRLLIERLPALLPVKSSAGRRQGAFEALDMGCGDGILAAWLARRGATVTAVDISAFAVEATRRTLAANGLEGEVVASDVYSALSGRCFDAIVSNPPFHQQRDIDYGPAARLIGEAPEHLRPGGQLVVVANAFLPYPALLERAFGGFEILADDRRFRVYRAVKA